MLLQIALVSSFSLLNSTKLDEYSMDFSFYGYLDYFQSLAISVSDILYLTFVVYVSVTDGS